MIKPKNKGHWLKITLLIFNCFSVLTLLGSYSAAYISPIKFWLLAFFGIAYPVVLLINFVFVLLWLILWNRYIWLSLLTILLGYGHIRTIFPLRSGTPKTHAVHSMRVVT